MRRINSKNILNMPIPLIKGAMVNQIEDKNLILKSSSLITWNGSSLTAPSNLILKYLYNDAASASIEYTIATNVLPWSGNAITIADGEVVYFVMPNDRSSSATLVANDLKVDTLANLHSNNPLNLNNKDLIILFYRDGSDLYDLINFDLYESGFNGKLGVLSAVNQFLSNLNTPTAINESLISDTNNTDDLGSDPIEWKDIWIHNIKHNDSGNPDLSILTTGNNGNIILTPNGTGKVQPTALEPQGDWTFGGMTIIDSKDYLSSLDFLSTTGLYGWNFNESSWSNGGVWVGSENLTQVGTIGSSANHLGTSTVCAFDGTTDAAYANSSTFDTTNESFTVGGWYRANESTPLAQETFISKGGSTVASRSFQFIRQTNNNLAIKYNYDAAGGENELTIPASEVGDGNFHHVVAQYGYISCSVAYLSIYIDGKCRAYKKIDAIGEGNRNNNSTAKLTIGALNGSVLAINLLDGEFSDVFYKKSMIEANEIRAIYARGCQKYCVKEGSGKIIINDERQNNGFQREFLSSSTGVATTSPGTTVGNLKLYVPETGWYNIKAEGSFIVWQSGATGASLYMRMTQNNTLIDGTAKWHGILDTDLSSQSRQSYSINFNKVYLQKNDYIDFQAWEDSSDDCEFPVSSSLSQPYIYWEKID